MGFLDIFLAVFLALGLVKGFRNGFFVELASLVSVLLGIYVAIKFSYLTQSYLKEHFSSNPKTIQVLAFGLTFILVIIAVSLLAKVFTSIVNFASLGLLNNILGAFLGLLRTVLVMSILLNLFQKINFDGAFLSEKTKGESVLYEPVQEVSRNIYPSISRWFEAFKSSKFEFENAEKAH